MEWVIQICFEHVHTKTVWLRLMINFALYFQLVTTQPLPGAGYAAATRYAIPTVATAATYGATRYFN